MTQSGVPEVFRPVTSRPVAIGCWVVCLLLLADVLRRGTWPSAAIATLSLGLLADAALALWWRPEIRADDAGVTLVNPLREVRVPWTAVTAVGGRWSLDVRTTTRRYTAFAAAPRGRPRRSRRGELPQVPESSIAASLATRWERGLGGRDPEGGAHVRWAWEVLVPGVLLVAGIVAVSLA
ncbi:PH (Pleckstrin Homology) domain-containing protein [Motilibacter rhizosphaerae]|uniref:PH (Pleckstrin Homology) domain-containing protein n=1 Tax=Motilibacter rhizosphaerae TaxID=598652 RepID=A0A4Q7NT65_9ACTN|nr:PH domain-containing protein [Motilibacter rhizosphaerae]RZS90255.1 PH (Pleckstrin Homology) domain-containing protein [Motilibacter rhizosphaerae]